ncbi:MAG: GNAT family N-acetyltransferase [Defluviitaleaceae bacterium]|nr:GNAT family N-acetyltransferase [Defluviitaleaceae bacterium]
MIFTWTDYQHEHEKETETWTDEDTIKFAINSTIKNEHEYYMKICDYDGHDYVHNDTYFCKIVTDGDIIVAVLFLLRDDKCPRGSVTINPIIVNPKLRNRGNCTKIVGALVKNADKIIGYGTNVFEAGIDANNPASIKAFEKAGFVHYETHADGDYFYYRYTNAQ